MSRVAEQLYFAPSVRFTDLDWSGERLPLPFQQRIAGFYLEPAVKLAKARHDFASGILAVCAMDALALFMTGSNGNARITGVTRKHVPELEHFQSLRSHTKRSICVYIQAFLTNSWL